MKHVLLYYIYLNIFIYIHFSTQNVFRKVTWIVFLFMFLAKKKNNFKNFKNLFCLNCTALHCIVNDMQIGEELKKQIFRISFYFIIIAMIKQEINCIYSPWPGDINKAGHIIVWLNLFFSIFLKNVTASFVELCNTRLLGRFAPIFYLNCEHVLFVYILKQRRKKFRGVLKKNSRISKIKKNFTKIKNF